MVNAWGGTKKTWSPGVSMILKFEWLFGCSRCPEQEWLLRCDAHKSLTNGPFRGWVPTLWGNETAGKHRKCPILFMQQRQDVRTKITGVLFPPSNQCACVQIQAHHQRVYTHHSFLYYHQCPASQWRPSLNGLDRFFFPPPLNHVTGSLCGNPPPLWDLQNRPRIPE